MNTLTWKSIPGSEQYAQQLFQLEHLALGAELGHLHTRVVL
jgi:hypothetical protein